MSDQVNLISKNRFALLCDWPEIKAAENEAIKRFIKASRLINKEAIVINRKGEVIDLEKRIFSSKKYVTNSEIDFVINLHFSSPKTYDGYSYVLLWNPLQFPHDWDYKKSARNMASNHDAISCTSSFADECFYRHSTIHNNKHLYPKIILNHTNSGPYFDFHDDKEGILYCGIGWDKSTTNKQRFQEVFHLLDKYSILKIYGPKRLGLVEPWKDFKSYKGEIPFDGESLFKTISQSLLGLAISHPAHIETQIATSRIFEIIAGGTLPLCDNNEFIRKNFGDKVLYIEGETHEEKVESIRKQYQWALENKSVVKSMVEELQRLMKSKFDLSVQLQEMYNQHFSRRKEIENLYCAKSQKFHVNVIYYLFDEEDDLNNLIRSYKSQVYENKSLFVLTNLPNPDLSNLDKSGIKYQILTADKKLDQNQIGLMLQANRDSLPKGPEELYMVFTENSQLFYDHVTSLVRIFEDNSDLEVADCITSRRFVTETILLDDETLVTSNHMPYCKPLLLRDFAPFYVMNSLSLSYFTAVNLFYFKKVNNSNKVTFISDNKVLDLENTYNNKSLFFDTVLMNRQLVSNKINGQFCVTKNMIMEVMEKISFFKYLAKTRKAAMRFRDKLRKIRKKKLAK